VAPLLFFSLFQRIVFVRNLILNSCEFHYLHVGESPRWSILSRKKVVMRFERRVKVMKMNCEVNFICLCQKSHLKFIWVSLSSRWWKSTMTDFEQEKSGDAIWEASKSNENELWSQLCLCMSAIPFKIYMSFIIFTLVKVHNDRFWVGKKWWCDLRGK
jgi:hypothetical protein